MAGRVAVERPRTTAGQHLSLLAGVLLIALGVAGFFVTGFSGWTEGTREQQVIGFAVNPLANVVHLVLGALGVLARTGARRARWYGVLLIAACVAMFLYSRNVGGGVLNANWPTSALHLVFAFAGLVIAFVPVRAGKRPSTAELG